MSTKAFKPFDIIKDFLLKKAKNIAYINDEKKAICNFGCKAANKELGEEIFDPMFK